MRAYGSVTGELSTRERLLTAVRSWANQLSLLSWKAIDPRQTTVYELETSANTIAIITSEFVIRDCEA